MRNFSRREWINLTVGTGAAFAFAAEDLLALQQPVLTRVIPSTKESIPVIGLGSSATFSTVARSEDVTALRDVLKTLLDNGGKVFDTAPGYGASEEVAGKIVRDEKLGSRVFWATKVNVAGRGSNAADPAAARAQIEASFTRVGKPVIDLIQVHNLGDVKTQLPILRELKKQGRVRHIGVTTTFDQQYDELVALLKNEQLDFVGVDYAVDGREVDQTILPLARDRGVAVLAYAPFGRTRLFRRVGERPVPDWAKEIDATTWAQVFLKWVLGNPAITAVTPATSQPKNMLDNLNGGRGRVPDEALRKRIAAYIDALPSA